MKHLVSLDQSKNRRNLYSITKNNRLTMTASLITGLLISLSPNYSVQAESLEEANERIDVKELYADYHSLLKNEKVNGYEDNLSDGVDQEKVDDQSEEIKLIKETLILAIEKAGNAELVAAIREENLTIDELDDIFKVLVEDIIDSEEKVEPETESEEEIIKEEKAEVQLVSNFSTKSETEELPASEESEGVSTKLKTGIYIVKAGDTLNKIAKQHETTVQELVTLNKIKNIHQISVGQSLKIYQTDENIEELAKPHSQSEFIDILGEYAKTVAKEQNLYASVMIAQAALETGFGQSSLSSVPNHNLYGMKGSYQGSSVTMPTKEYSQSKGWYTVHAQFKKYPSYLESLLDHASYIRRGPSWAPNYYSGVWLENTSSYRDATASLQGRYATDPNYANKLNTIIERYQLTRYDIFEETDENYPDTPPTNNNKPIKPVTPSTGDKELAPIETIRYTIKAGDTLSQIARNFEMTVNELKDLNHLKTDLIFVGQKIKVKKVNSQITKPENKPELEEKPVETEKEKYLVIRGDTLSKIARDHGMTVSELKELNGLSSDLIFVGQSLKTKKSAESTNKPSSKPTPPVLENKKDYTIKAGDTLSKIARNYGMTVNELKSLNALSSDLIFVGQKLQIKSVTVAKPNSKPSPQPVKPSETVKSTYTVKAGDTLSKIAREYNMTISELKKINHLKSDLIFVKQELKLNNHTEVTKATPKEYRVEKGDTLYQIALKNKTSVKTIKTKNKLTTDLIYVGQILDL